MPTRKTSPAVRLLDRMIGKEESFGDLLEALRLADEVSQVDFARRLGIAKQHLCDIEKGRKLVSPERAAQFARVLGFAEASFVGRVLQDAVNRAGLKLKVEVRVA